MRRRARDSDGVPPVLVRFDPAEWSGRAEERFAAWKQARVLWHDAHGWPGGPLALLCGASDVQRRLAGQPLLSWGRTPAEVAELNGERSYRPRPRARE